MVEQSGSIVMAVLIFLTGFGFGRLSARRGSVSPARSAPPPREINDAAIDAQIRAGNKVEAIKLYRQRTGAGLKTAKLAVEQRAAQCGKRL